MTKRILPSPEVLRQLLSYDPGTGKLYWKERPIDMFKDNRSFNTWNSRYAGKEALTAVSTGYRYGRLFDSGVLAHRVIWAMNNGEWPMRLIDHINGDKIDNRMCNLRLATQSENLKNRGKQKNNTSGYKGVYFRKDTGKWASSIWSEGVEIKLGSRFNSADSAHKAYCRAAEKYHGEFARTE